MNNMNKWNNPLNIQSEETTACNCSNSGGLFVPNRQLSLIVSSLLFLFFSAFMIGYFCGKKTAIEEHQSNNYNASAAQSTQEITIADHHKEENNRVNINNSDSNSDIKQYYAQLIGFGTEKAAQSFVEKLALKGIETKVQKRTSKTAQGRISYWYQVVTVPYKDRNELSLLVDTIAKEENIKGAFIKTYYENKHIL